MLLVVITTMTTQAQTVQWATTINEQSGRTKPFEHLDLSLTTGSTGLGIDFASPINDLFTLRGGFSWMPPISPTMTFGVQVGDDPSTSQSKFERLSGLLNSLTGFKVNNSVDMKGVPTYYHVNLMLDVTPFRNKNWHFTAGLYLGPSNVAHAYNTTEDMPSLMAVSIYNNLYDKVISSPVLTDTENYFFTYTYGEILEQAEILDILGINIDNISDPNIRNLLYSTWASFPIQNPDGSWDSNGNFIFDIYNRIAKYGRMGIHIGDYRNDVLDEAGNIIHKQGDPYMVEPNEDSMVKAWVKVNRLKPYLGFGYGGRLSKKDDSWRISFDAGALFWGGTPKVVTHDGTDLIGDVEHVGGKVGRYVDIINQFKVFPVLNLRITKRLF